MAFEQIGEDFAVDHVHLHPAFESLRWWAQRYVFDLVVLVFEKLDQLAGRDLLRAPVLTEVSGGSEESFGFLDGLEERYRFSIVEYDRKKLLRFLRSTGDDYVVRGHIHNSKLY